MNTVKSPDITRITLSVLFIAALIGSSIWVLKPFLPAIIWSMMVVIATWPVMTGLRQRLGGRKTPAVIIMTLLLLLVFVVPFSLALATIVANSATIADWIRAFARFRLPGSPEWMLSIPLAGPKIAAKWNELLAVPHEELAGALAPHAAKFLRWFIAEAGSVGMLFVHFLLTVLLSSFLYFNGEDAAQAVLRFARRLGGVRGENAAHLAQAAIRAVALGVVVTALVQSLASWAGLAICGVPYAILLTALVFVFGVIQI
ncbi:MAG TPA: AI-2E family transporter, partial [Oligoflexia bacterium]|nr:AI-2E family transporter [Oligoflexia bacterium]